MLGITARFALMLLAGSAVTLGTIGYGWIYSGSYIYQM